MTFRAVWVAVAVVVAPGISWGQFAVQTDGRANPGDFQVTTFATGLYYPTSMQQLPDGSLLVAASVPKTGGSFYNSTGQLVRLVDANNDGVADAPPQVLAGGLPAGISSVRTAGRLVVATSGGAGAITLLRAGASASDSLTSVASIQFAFPSNTQHGSYALAVRTIAPGSHEVFFNLGSRSNASNDATPVVASGLINANLAPESIWSFTINETDLSVSNVRQIASGLRNAAGMTFARNGDLLFEDNGIDGLVSPAESHSADELNRIAAADIGGAIEDFGFASTYERYRTGEQVGSAGVLPLVTFQPIPMPNGSESEGASEIAQAPLNWPVGLRDGVFVGFHGQFNSGGLANEENPVVWADPSTGDHFHFVSNDLATIGHPDGLLSTNDALFLSDVSSGSMFSTAATGTIYRITYLPEPATLSIFGLLLTLAARQTRRCRRGGVGDQDDVR